MNDLERIPDATRDVVVVGAGLAGLTAAAYLARAGLAITVLDRAVSPGGRADTHVRDGYHLNLGPHALYRAGAAHAILTELGVPFSGGTPSTEGLALLAGELHGLPTSPRGLLKTSLLGARGKLEVARFVATVGSRDVDSEAWARTTVAGWLDEQLHDARAQLFAEALIRLSTYSNAPSLSSAGAALGQVRRALRGGVIYLDGGWRHLVEGLTEVATSAGASVHTHTSVAAVLPDEAGFRVILETGQEISSRAVLVAGSPQVAAHLLGPGTAPALDAAAANAVPVVAACLDVALESLPEPGRSFALGIDQPLYYSVHSKAAALAPRNGAVLHVAKYLPLVPAGDAAADRAELEAFLDRLQPGWRERAVHQRFLRRMVVQHDMVHAERGGLAGRPGPEVAGRPGYFVAGDWLGPAGFLADAAVASGRRAARSIVAHLDPRIASAA